MSDRKARTWQGKLFWAVAGAVAGSISTVLVDQAKDWAMEAATHREALFGEAMALRRAAIPETARRSTRKATRPSSGRGGPGSPKRWRSLPSRSATGLACRARRARGIRCWSRWRA